MNKFKNHTSMEVLTLYINSGGKKASYRDVVEAVNREKRRAHPLKYYFNKLLAFLDKFS